MIIRPCTISDRLSPGRLSNRAAGYLPIHLPGDPLAAASGGGERAIIDGHCAAHGGHCRAAFYLEAPQMP